MATNGTKVAGPPAVICAAVLPNGQDKAMLKMGFLYVPLWQRFSLTLINSLKTCASVYLLVNGEGIVL